MGVLAFEIEFLGPVLLSDPSHPKQAEWPPAPARVYAALIAAVHEHELGPDILAAVRTLEQAAPALTATEAGFYPSHDVMVPVAHSLSYPFVRKQYGAQTACEVVPLSPRVVYHWPVPDAARSGVARAVEHLIAVGRGESLVLGRVLDEATTPQPNWQPDPAGHLALRVPGVGRYETLERDYQRGRSTVDPDLTYPYRRLDTRTQPAFPQGPWRELLSLQLLASADIRTTALLTDAFRQAVLARVGDSAHFQIHGHTSEPHVAWAALPNIGHDHADGRVTGLGVWLPDTLDAVADQQLRRALAALQTIHFRGRHMPVALPSQSPYALRRETWTGPARIWATATPLVLDHRISCDTEAATAIAKSIRRAGYPQPDWVSASSVPSLKGAAHAGETRPRRSHHPRRHALVEFAAPIQGPLLAGAERHFGLGLFRPIH